MSTNYTPIPIFIPSGSSAPPPPEPRECSYCGLHVYPTVQTELIHLGPCPQCGEKNCWITFDNGGGPRASDVLIIILIVIAAVIISSSLWWFVYRTPT